MRIKSLPFFAKKGVTIHAFFSRSIIKKPDLQVGFLVNVS